ncbi:PREDICTED: uncharacterized protein LOC104804417 [Tarenaya hassleriana]|uniref:uncharacterized protein LOC104804417 n=1 Tax=Tarenaya hassleriana TaxID=28532 RepID=UPI00053C1C79|nr:PREDICTED: uncharacterized protein LOC104804417 [Tarenaya hassleriana]
MMPTHTFLVRDAYLLACFSRSQPIGFRLMFRDSVVHVHGNISFDRRHHLSIPNPHASSVASRRPTLSPRSNPNPISDVVQEAPVNSEKKTKTKKRNSELFASSVTTNPNPTSDVVQEAPVPSEEEAKAMKRNSELFANSVTVNPNPASDVVQEALVPSEGTRKRKNSEPFARSVTTNRSPSPRHVPIPMFYVRERIKLSNPRFDVKKSKRA